MPGGILIAQERCHFLCATGEGGLCQLAWVLALALLVARVFADHHDHTVTADHFALVADRLNARLDLHRIPLR